MNATILDQGHRFARGLLVLLVTVVAMSVLQAAPASAYTTRKIGSYPGRVIGYQVQGSHHDSCPSPYYTCFIPWVVGTGPAVYRSPASNGTQKILAVYQLQRWNGSSWINYASQMHTRYLYAGYSWLRMPRVDFLPNSAGYFRVVIAVAWANGAETVAFGGKKLIYNQSGDFTCNTRFPCEAGAGWVWLRSPGV